MSVFKLIWLRSALDYVNALDYNIVGGAWNVIVQSVLYFFSHFGPWARDGGKREVQCSSPLRMRDCWLEDGSGPGSSGRGNA